MDACILSAYKTNSYFCGSFCASRPFVSNGTHEFYTALALFALAANDGEGHHDPVAHLQSLFSRPNLDGLALHSWHKAVVKVKAGAANDATRNLHDGVAAIFDFPVGHGLVANTAHALPA